MSSKLGIGVETVHRLGIWFTLVAGLESTANMLFIRGSYKEPDNYRP